MDDAHVYKLLTLEDWNRAAANGVTATALDTADGYVHLSSRADVAETARLHFAGQTHVRLLEFAVSRLPPLKWEESRGGKLFPHLYGDLEVDRADRSWTLATGPDGAPVMPEDF